jgi:hypothetical protein
LIDQQAILFAARFKGEWDQMFNSMRKFPETHIRKEKPE